MKAALAGDMPRYVIGVLVMLLAGPSQAGPLHRLGRLAQVTGLRVKAKVMNLIAPVAGYTELLGFRYAVKPYHAPLTEKMTRGSRIENAADVAALKAQGIKTVVSFCAERNRAEERAVKAAGLSFVRIGVIDNKAPSQRQIRRFLDVATDPQSGPIYAHCEAGKGRTGVFIGAWRMAALGWPSGKAVAEAHRYGLSLRSQSDALRDFGRALREGKIAGYPLPSDVGR
jgi:protein tyrosine phosphatase (PTP) superfamily phosphohydrolase (DUF442 family)